MDESFGPAALAIYLGDLDQLRAFLADDPGLSTRTSSVSHPTLLQLVAVDASQIVDPVGAARILVDAGAATHLPLVSAAGCGSREVLEFFLDGDVPIDGEDLSWTPLDESIYWAQTEIIDFLVGRGASLAALSTAAGVGDLQAVDNFFTNGSLASDARAIGSPFPGTIPADLGTDPTSIVDHAFVMAVNAGQRTTAERLLAAGARINAQPPGYHWHGTALHAAVWRGDRGMVEWLLRLGADPTVRDGLANSDASGWARHHGHPSIEALLA